MAVLRSDNLSESAVGYGMTNGSPSDAEYPYRYPELDSVLDAAPSARFTAGATTLGAVLTVLEAQPPDSFTAQEDSFVNTNAGAVAFGVLDRVRRSGACEPQLNLLLLLASDQLTTPTILDQEQKRTELACPDDPTAGWLVGQSQLRNVPLADAATGLGPETVASVRKATRTFARLAVRYPEDAGIIAGLADSYLRAGTHLLASKPFTARQDFRSAVDHYNRVSALGYPRDAAIGISRALIGLGEPADAARLLQQYAQSGSVPGPLLELLITATESAHDFRAAEAAAKRLDRLGPSTYGDIGKFFPSPTYNSVSMLDDATVSLSFGSGRLTPFNTFLLPAGGAGGSALDLSFIPQYRHWYEEVMIPPYCAAWAWRRAAILNGHAAQALTGWPNGYDASARPGISVCGIGGDLLRQIARAEVGQKVDHSVEDFPGDIEEHWQNLLRWAGDLPGARRVADKWQLAVGDKSAKPALRLGEIDYLMHRYHDAAAEFALAARRSRLVAPRDELAVAQAELNRGAALLAAGRTTEGAQSLRLLDRLATQNFAIQNASAAEEARYIAVNFATVSYFACELLADYERESGDLHAAIEDYTTALSWSDQVKSGSGVRPEVLNNNAALAYLGLGQTSKAVSLEKKALALDGLDPTFLMTAGFIADQAGNIAQAARYDRLALQSDPGAFPAANDLGVELSLQHHDQAAESAFRQAIGANPSYALGWFNLGVLESNRGPTHMIAAQGAFAKAYQLDSSLKDRRHRLTIDASVYRTALDLSKPLPARWSLAQLQRPAPVAAAGLLTVVVLGFGLVKASGQGGASLAERWLGPISQRLDSVPILVRFRHPAFAVTATVITFLLSRLRHAADIIELAVYLVGVLVLVGAAMTARATLALLRGNQLGQISWLPGIAFGIVTGAFGLPWAPLPVIREDANNDPQLHLAAPLTLSGLSLALFLESAWLHTPVTQSWAVAGLIMAASTLLPVAPLDGSRIGKTGIMTGAGVAGGALLVGLGLI